MGQSGAQEGGLSAAAWAGAAWLVCTAFTCAVMWESGRHWGGQHRCRPAPDFPTDTMRVRPRETEPPAVPAPRFGFVPMSQRPDMTLVELPPVVTRIQPRVATWSTRLDTPENGPVVSDSHQIY